jgi:hypothetical protein
MAGNAVGTANKGHEEHEEKAAYKDTERRMESTEVRDLAGCEFPP